MKRVYTAVALTCVVILTVAFNWFRLLNLFKLSSG